MTDFGTDFGTADKAKHRGSAKSKSRRCRAEKVKGGRWMAFCPNKRPRFVTEGQAHAMNRGRRKR